MSSDDSFHPHSEECECGECCDSIDSTDDRHAAIVYSILDAFEAIADDYGYKLEDVEILEEDLLELFFRFAKKK